MSLNKLMRSSGKRSTDPLFSKVALLMHMDGEDGGVLFPEVRGSVTTPSNVITKTNVKHSGTASAYFNHANANIHVANSKVPVVGYQSFSIEATFFPEQISIGTILSCASPGNGGYEWAFYFQDGYLKFYVGRRGFYALAIAVPMTMTPGKKCRVSVERDEFNVWRMYVDGTSYIPILVLAQGAPWTPGTNVWANTPLYVGCFWPGLSPLYGHLDELRVTIGEARGKGNPMVDTGLPFPDF